MMLIESEIDRILTQYRESPNLLHVMRTFLGQVLQVANAADVMPSFFDIDSAVGDQLTFLGKRLGFPRCHCVCAVQPVFGFVCNDGTYVEYPVVGLCDDTSTWVNCGVFGVSDVCLDNDEIYRSFLKVRRHQILNNYDLASLTESVKLLWGPTAVVMDAGVLRVVVAPGRSLTAGEQSLLQLYARVLPLAPGVEMRYHFGEIRVFGFGEGWGGLEETSIEETETSVAYQRTGKIFGFCEETDPVLGGFCEVWDAEGLPIITGTNDSGDNEYLVTEDDEQITTGPLTSHASWLCRKSAPWMCEIDVHPYSC